MSEFSGKAEVARQDEEDRRDPKLPSAGLGS
jgi:hypothetical protein